MTKNFINGEIRKGAFVGHFPQFHGKGITSRFLREVQDSPLRRPNSISAAAMKIVGSAVFVSDGNIVCLTNDAARRLQQAGAQLLPKPHKLPLYGMCA